MKRLSDLVDSADRDTALAARVLRAYGALSLPLASQQRVREALSASTSSVPPHLMRRAALGLTVGLVAVVGVQAKERGWGARHHPPAPNRHPDHRQGDASQLEVDGEEATMAATAASASAPSRHGDAARPAPAAGAAPSRAGRDEPRPGDPVKVPAAGAMAVAPSTATASEPADPTRAAEATTLAPSTSAPLHAIPAVTPIYAGRGRGTERLGGAGVGAESARPGPAPLDDEGRLAAPLASSAGAPVVALPVPAAATSGSLPAWPAPQEPPSNKALPSQPGGPGLRRPGESGLARGDDRERRPRFTPASMAPPAPTAEAPVAVAVFTGVVGGGAVRATVALADAAHETTVRWDDPRGEPVVAGATSDGDPHEAAVDLDGDGEPDVVVRDEECPPAAGADEDVGGVTSPSVCVYLREETDR